MKLQIGGLKYNLTVKQEQKIKKFIAPMKLMKYYSETDLIKAINACVIKPNPDNVPERSLKRILH